MGASSLQSPDEPRLSKDNIRREEVNRKRFQENDDDDVFDVIERACKHKQQ